MVIFYSFLILISLVNKKYRMKSFNDQQDIGLFSHLIQTILYCRFSKKLNIDHQISLMIDKLRTGLHDDTLNLNLGIQMIAKLHEGSDFKVNNVLKKHFLDHDTNKYCIYLEIFTPHNKRQQQYFSRQYERNMLLEKWVFHKQTASKNNYLTSLSTEKHSDMILKVLCSIREQLKEQKLENFNNDEISHNTTSNKSYQLVIKSKCCKKQKFVTHVFHHERNNSQPFLHTQYIKSCLLQLPRYWEKSIKFESQVTVSVGCYFPELSFKETNAKTQPISDIVFLRQPDRKMSSETKAEQKQKESTSSFKFSLQNFPFRLSGNKGLKHSSAELSIRKTSEQILNHHRPRYQSIYESKDEEMNIFILSPRKLSQQQSPKAKHLQQKTIQFQIHDQKYVRGISEQVIEEFVLQQDENVSNVSSDGFQLLEQNDQLDSIREEKLTKSKSYKESLPNSIKKEALDQVNNLEKKIVDLLSAIDRTLLLYV